MKTVEFRDLHKMEFDLHFVSIVHQIWQDREIYRVPEGGRRDNGIMFLSDCSFEYLTPDGRVYERALRDDIVYAPKRARYICRFDTQKRRFSEKERSNYLINFILTDEMGEEFILANDRMIIPTEKKKYYRDSFARIDSLGRKGFAPSARIKAMLYDLLCDISLDLEEDVLMKRSFSAIYPAIQYIEATDLSAIDTARLSELCGISRSCFHRLFREYAGMTPKAYVNHMKIKQAQKMLQSGSLTVAETAEALGYGDASYFSRYYKRITGRSPSRDKS